MSSATTLTLHTVTSADNLQHAQLQYQSYAQQQQLSTNSNNSKINAINTSSTSYYQFPALGAAEERFNNLVNSSYTALTNTDDTMLLERSQSTPTANTKTLLLHKSSSCNAMFKPKSTILIQDSANGRINTSLTDSESDFGVNINTGEPDVANELGCNEQDAFLAASSSNSARRSNNSNRLYSKSKSKSICYRAHAFITRNWYLSYLVPLSILLALMFVAYLTRDYAAQLLYWIETQNPWVIFAIFMILFIVVSFPVIVGYFVLMITSGYLFGLIKGLLTVILGANLGIAIAHVTIRSLRHRIPMHKLIKNETGRAILRVISGPRAFKVVLFTRLTPIPFGIQNAIFGVSSINPRIYHTATFLGLLPAQTINVYLGSTLRSMHEVLNNHGTALTGYISFGIEVVCGVALMFWVVQKARKELSETLLSDITNEGKLIDIQV